MNDQTLISTMDELYPDAYISCLQAREWLEYQLNYPLEEYRDLGRTEDARELPKQLSDGALLCQVLQVLSPGSILPEKVLWHMDDETSSLSNCSLFLEAVQVAFPLDDDYLCSLNDFLDVNSVECFTRVLNSIYGLWSVSAESEILEIVDSEEMPLSDDGLSKSGENNHDNMAVENDSLLDTSKNDEDTDAVSHTSADGSTAVVSVSRPEKRLMVIRELVATESSFADDMNAVISGYYEKIDDRLNMLPEDKESLFGNIQQVRDFSVDFLSRLEPGGEGEGSLISIAKAFIDMKPSFSVYTAYCANQPHSVGVMTEYLDDPSFGALLQGCKLMLGHTLDLSTYLLKPVQRVLKYPLLLREMERFTAPDEPGASELAQAVSDVKEVASHINEMRRWYEAMEELLELQSHIVDWGYSGSMLGLGCGGADLSDFGKIVLRGTMRVSEGRGVKPTVRYCFLLERLLLVFKEETIKEGMKVKVVLELSEVTCTTPSDTTFDVVRTRKDKDKKKLTVWVFNTRSAEERDKWATPIKRVSMLGISNFIAFKSNRETTHSASSLELNADQTVLKERLRKKQQFMTTRTSVTSKRSSSNIRSGSSGSTGAMRTLTRKDKDKERDKEKEKDKDKDKILSKTKKGRSNWLNRGSAASVQIDQDKLSDCRNTCSSLTHVDEVSDSGDVAEELERKGSWRSTTSVDIVVERRLSNSFSLPTSPVLDSTGSFSEVRSSKKKKPAAPLPPEAFDNGENQEDHSQSCPKSPRPTSVTSLASIIMCSAPSSPTSALEPIDIPMSPTRKSNVKDDDLSLKVSLDSHSAEEKNISSPSRRPVSMVLPSVSESISKVGSPPKHSMSQDIDPRGSPKRPVSLHSASNFTELMASIEQPSKISISASVGSPVSLRRPISLINNFAESASSACSTPPTSSSVEQVRSPRSSVGSTRPVSPSVEPVRSPRSSVGSTRPVSPSVEQVRSPRSSVGSTRPVSPSVEPVRSPRSSADSPQHVSPSVEQVRSPPESSGGSTPKHPISSSIEQDRSPPRVASPLFVPSRSIPDEVPNPSITLSVQDPVGKQKPKPKPGVAVKPLISTRPPPLGGKNRPPCGPRPNLLPRPSLSRSHTSEENSLSRRSSSTSTGSENVKVSGKLGSPTTRHRPSKSVQGGNISAVFTNNVRGRVSGASDNNIQLPKRPPLPPRPNVTRLREKPVLPPRPNTAGLRKKPASK